MPAVECTPTELMTVAAARCLTNADVCFVGIGLPSAACNLARLTHAPRITLIYESGTIATRPEVLPLSIGDGDLCRTALNTVSVPEFFRYWLQGGRVTIGFLGAAQIDRYANLNTTVIGDYARPATRLPGAGGAPEMAQSCREIYVTLPHSRRAFVPRLDFITSLGHGEGGDARARAGIATLGPTRVITDLCIMTPDPDTKELTVTSLHPGVSVARVREATGWPVLIADTLTETSPPTAHEIEVLRDLHRRSEAAYRGLQS
jgi:glutaconate CoA-transferase, subunit B